MTLIPSIALLLALAVPSITAVTVAVQDQAPDRFQPAPYERQSIRGLLGRRMEINLEKRLLRVDERSLLLGFLERPGKHMWIGEHAGKFLHAGVNSYRYTRNEQLRAMMDRMVAGLLSTQLPDGYLGTYPDDRRWTSWDVWVHKYNLIGLLSYYELTGDQRVLAACRRIGDLLVRTFGEGTGQRDIIKSGTHVGMAATSVLEPVCSLYRFTGDRRYLNFALYLTRAWNEPHGPHIISALLETRSVLNAGNAKAYELMSNLVGLADLYRLTGNREFLESVFLAWQDIRDKRRYISGTTSSGEYFRGDNVLPGEASAAVGEGCATVTWLQLNWQLLRLTGEAQYAEELERTVYNQLLAAQDPLTGNICYFTPLNGRKQPGSGISCCVSSEPRGISMIPQIIWGARDKGLAVELYAPGEAVIPVRAAKDPVAVRVKSETDFPVSGQITLTVSPERATRFPIWLRVPAWSDGFVAEASGARLRGEPGKYMQIDREWRSGDVIHIKIGLPARVLDGGLSYGGFVAIQRGPQVLALERRLNPDVPVFHRAGPAAASQGTVLLTDAMSSLPNDWPGAQAYAVDGIVAVPAASGVPGRRDKRTLILVPFSDAVQYRVWLPRPERISTEPVSLTAFGRELYSFPGQRMEPITDERPETYATIRSSGRNVSGWFGVELQSPAEIKRVVFRHGKTAKEGGWFDTMGGKPEIQIQRERNGAWETVAALDAYPWIDYTMIPDFKDGQPFEVVLKAPVRAVAIRVTGKPAREYASCAELSAYGR